MGRDRRSHGPQPGDREYGPTQTDLQAARLRYGEGQYKRRRIMGLGLTIGGVGSLGAAAGLLFDYFNKAGFQQGSFTELGIGLAFAVGSVPLWLIGLNRFSEQPPEHIE